MKKIELKEDFKLYISAIISFFANLLFMLLNFGVGVIYRLAWNFSVAFYYLFLLIVKAIFLLSEKRLVNKTREEIQKTRKRVFKVQNIFMGIIDIALIAPIVLMALERRVVNVGEIAAIGFAAYTTYKVTMSIVTFIKVKSSDNITLTGFKMIGLKEAIVSIMTLQYILVSVFGEASDMKILTTVSMSGMLLVMFVISILAHKFFFIKTRKSDTDAD